MTNYVFSEQDLFRGAFICSKKILTTHTAKISRGSMLVTLLRKYC